MRFLPLIFKNATRNLRRTLLTVLSAAASLGLLTLLVVVEDSMRGFIDRAGRSLRVSVRHKTSFAVLLPIAYRKKIESVPGVVATCPFSWYGGNFRDPREILPSLSCDPDTLLSVWGDRLEATRAEWSSFRADRMGAMIAPFLAARFGWKVGDTVSLTGRVVPVDLTFRISGVLRETFDPMIFLFHREYLEAAIGNPGEVGNFWLRVDRPENVRTVIRTINEMFANASHPVVAETEKSLVEMITGMLRMFRFVVLVIGAAVLTIIMLVTANTIAMSVRERIWEVGVLRALGFKGWHILLFLLGEASFMSAIGGLVGSTLALLFCRWSVSILPAGPVAALLAVARPELIFYGIAASIFVGMAGGIVPASAAARISVSQALRQVA